jgi:hypothetical protein
MALSNFETLVSREIPQLLTTATRDLSLGNDFCAMLNSKLV